MEIIEDALDWVMPSKKQAAREQYAAARDAWLARNPESRQDKRYRRGRAWASRGSVGIMLGGDAKLCSDPVGDDRYQAHIEGVARAQKFFAKHEQKVALAQPWKARAVALRAAGIPIETLRADIHAAGNTRKQTHEIIQMIHSMIKGS